MNQFMEVKAKNLDTLKQFVPIVKKVHGGNHQEFHDVVIEFNKIVSKLDNNNYQLKDEFKQLKLITNNYLVPSDVCESYQAVYEMLEELNTAYQNIG